MSYIDEPEEFEEEPVMEEINPGWSIVQWCIAVLVIGGSWALALVDLYFGHLTLLEFIGR